MQTRERWVRLDPRTAYRLANDPTTGEHYVSGFVMYGPVTTERLRAVSLRQLGEHVELAVPANLTPTESEVAGEPHPDDVWPLTITSDGAGTVSLTEPDGTTVLWKSRALVPDMSTADWYTMTASLFRLVAALHPANPTKALADYCDVPFTTAVRWVRECRQRGYLPKSSRQLGKARGEQQA